MENLLKETKLLNYNHSDISALIITHGWKKLSEKDRILKIYNFVRDDIAFGYNFKDAMPAAKVLKNGYGQCNTKGILFMALLRATGIPCRIHGFMVDKKMQKGAIKGWYFKQAPKEILHTWVEIFYNNKWLNLEGFILDMKYLNKLQIKFKDCKCPFYEYGVATPNLHSLQIEWNENDTYIQKDSITKDLGIFNTPDELFAVHKQQIGFFKTLIFRCFVRRSMNKNVKRIRNQEILKEKINE